VWWASKGDMDFRGVAEYPYNNLARPNTVVNMIIVSNTAVAGQSNDALSIQCKYDCWLDYVTSDNTLGSVKVTAHADEWMTIMAYVSNNYIFSKNVDHEKVLAFLKSAVKFMMSGDPKAVAIRKAVTSVGKTVGKAAITGAMALL